MNKLILMFLLMFCLGCVLYAQDDAVLWTKDFEASAFAFPPNDNYVAVGAGGIGVAKFDILTGEEIGRFPEIKNEGPISLSFSPDGKYLAGGSYYGRIFVWDTETGVETEIQDLGSMPGLEGLNAIFDIEFSPDGTKLAVAARKKGVIIYETGTWKVLKHKEEIYFNAPYGDEPVTYNHVSFRYDSKVLALGRYNAPTGVELYDIEKDTVYKTYQPADDGEFSKTRNELVIHTLQWNSGWIGKGVDYYKYDISEEPIHLDFHTVDRKLSDDGNFLLLYGNISCIPVISTNDFSIKHTYNIGEGYSFDNAIIDPKNKYLCIEDGFIYMLEIGNYLGVNEKENPSLSFNLEVIPNPTKNLISINYYLSEPGKTIIDLLDLKGNLISKLKSEFQDIGNYKFDFDLSKYPIGAYFVRLEQNGKVETIKFIYTK